MEGYRSEEKCVGKFEIDVTLMYFNSIFFNECACYHFAGICNYIFLCLQKLANSFENLRSTPGSCKIYICLKFIKFNV